MNAVVAMPPNWLRCYFIFLPFRNAKTPPKRGFLSCSCLLLARDVALRSIQLFMHFPRKIASEICRHLYRTPRTLANKVETLQNSAKHQFDSRTFANTIQDASR